MKIAFRSMLILWTGLLVEKVGFVLMAFVQKTVLFVRILEVVGMLKRNAGFLIIAIIIALLTLLIYLIIFVFNKMQR